MTKLLFFDMDGTLTTPRSGAKFPENPADHILMPGVAEVLFALGEAGWTMGVCSNQAGVESGYKTLEELEQELLFVLELTGMPIGLACPDMLGESVICVRKGLGRDADAESELRRLRALGHLGPFRKPGSGMLQGLAHLLEKESADWSEPSIREFVGDRNEDAAAAHASGFDFWNADSFFQFLHPRVSV
jgi:histidinol phosphatase-like enzyme